RGAVQAAVAGLVAGGPTTWTGRYRVRHDAGHWVHIWDSARLLRDEGGALVRVVGYSMDVSPQVEAEAAMRASEERLRRATSVVRGLVYDIDFSTGTVWRSDALKQLLGVDAADAPPHPQWWYERIHPDDWQRFQDLRRTYAAPVTDNEYRIRHEDGRWIRVWDRMQVEHDADGTARRAIGFTMDVSELMEAREAQRATETRLQLAMDGLGLAWWDQDLETGRFAVSDSFLALYGLARPSDDRLDPSLWRHLVHPDDLPRILAAVDAVQAGTAPQYAATYRIRRADDGEERIVSAYGRHLRDEAGRPVRWVGVVLDVTQEERARRAQRVEDERLRLAVEGAGMGTWELDTTTGRVAWSRSYFRMLGYEPTADGTTFVAWQRALLHPDDRARVRDLLELARRSRGPYAAEYRIIRANDGETRWLSSYGCFHYDDAGMAVRAVGVTFDVTARMRAEEALRQRAEEIEGLLSVLPAAVWYAHDPDCRMITGNAYASRLTPPVAGRNVSATLPDENRPWRLVAPEGEPLAITDMPLQRAVTTGRPLEGVELSVQRADGSRTPLLGGAVPLFDGDGRVRGAVAAFVDITDRKRVEEELREARLLFEKIAATAPGIIYLYDTVERRNVYANRALPEMLGYTPAEIAAAGPALGELITLPEDAARLTELHAEQRRMTPGEIRRQEMRMRHRDGSIRWIRGHETVFSTDADGTPRLILGLSLDITQEREAMEAVQASERRLRASERRLRELADAMPQIVFVNRGDGGIEFVNRQWELVTGSPYASDQQVYEQV
ncbi:MAG TPA: PAS domain-containing protein, partial [Gemmatimonadales bacterium]|nr:PAS domain-containing protein [Gemmatimonadales bacterium]